MTLFPRPPLREEQQREQKKIIFEKLHENKARISKQVFSGLPTMGTLSRWKTWDFFTCANIKRLISAYRNGVISGLFRL